MNHKYYYSYVQFYTTEDLLIEMYGVYIKHVKLLRLS